MKDEEMANESLIRYRKEPKWAGKMFMQDENTCYKDGFLAGLKAGRPQIHKVADGDLPRQDGNTCFSIDVLAENKKLVCYRFDCGKWFCGNREVEVTAWCEPPAFDKE